VKIRKSIVVAAGGLSLLAVALSGPASADTNVGSTTTLVGVGSDTTQSLVEGLSGVIKDSSNNPVISNYLATPVGRDISTRTGNANCTFTAPKNSGQGRDALVAALNGGTFGSPTQSANMTGCVDFARSSSNGAPTGTTPGGVTYIPMAIDSVTYATLNISNVPRSLTTAFLASVYSANTGNCVGTYQPLLPPFGSGTRTFFMQSLGLKDLQIGDPAGGGPGTCVKDVNASGTPIQEHDGRFLTNANQLLPFSTAQFIAQQAGYISNILGRAALGDVDTGSGSVSPLSLKTTFGLTREVYNVVGTNALGANGGANALDSTFATGSSKVCQATTTIEHYGFAPDVNCGNTTLVKGATP
jgi:ABC-type phosphate transport system substrate-binding protein